MKTLVIWMHPCVFGLMLFGCKDAQNECDTDADCENRCPDDTIPVLSVVPEEYREPNRLTFYVGTWAANPDLTFSGANGVSGPAQDFGIDDASTMHLRFQRTF